MGVLSTEGPEIDYDKINANYSMAASLELYDGKADSGVYGELTDV